MKKIITALVFTLIACVTIVGAYPSAIKAPNTIHIGIDNFCTNPDSVSRIRLSWTSVTDRQGQPVDYYNYRFYSNSIVVTNDTTSNTTTTTSRPCPAYGDSIIIYAEVWATDVRGTDGDIGRSGNLVIKTLDLRGPVAPVITIDTIASELQIDSIQIYATGASEKILNYFKLTNILGDGYSIQLCPLVFAEGNDVGFIPSNYSNRCTTTTGYLRPDNIYYSTQLYGD